MRFVPLLIALSLTGCFAGAGGRVEPAYYDLSGAVSSPVTSAQPSVESVSPAVPATFGLMLRLAEVRAPVWLNTPAMQYRLAYAEPERRQSFADSRWVAPPAELLELALRRSNVVRKSHFEAGGCQLYIDLDEFIQTFDTPGNSRALIEVRASLLAPRNAGQPKLLAQRTFRQSPPAGGDARTGVAGFSMATRGLNSDLNDWLGQLQRDFPDLTGRCSS